MSKGSKTVKTVKTTKTVNTSIEVKPEVKLEVSLQTTEKEEFLPIGKYKLEDLQRLALLYKIDTQKMGTMGKKINKLKAELYNELATKM